MELGFKAIDNSIAEHCGFGDYPVCVVPNYQIRLSDGCHLAGKFWLPFYPSDIEHDWFNGAKSYTLYEGKKGMVLEPQPVILEYLPYRKDDYTVPRDHRRHTWMSSQGYIVLRVDFRGAGDSDDLYWGEYLQQEQDDCCHLLQWLEQQPWCTGEVGMYGKSWGGFNSLEVAFYQPPQLKTAISIFSTDDRYANDIHYSGGCIVASEMLSWGSVMFAWNARPPTPYHVPRWKEEWRHRLESAAAPWVTQWLSHQHRDDFWKHGSICEDPSRINIPILSIGGWRDGYRDAPFRLATTLPKCRGLIGPWAHEWPDIAMPGPQIDFLNLCLDWWNCFLKHKGDSAMTDEPLLRLYLQDGMRPQPQSKIRNGRWVTAKEWPTTQEGFFTKTFVVDNISRKLLPEAEVEEKPFEHSSATTSFSANCGLWHGEMLSFGGPDLSGDQRFADADSLTWTTDVLEEDLGIVGNVKFNCTVSVDQQNAFLVARLCDVFPDGSSSLITYGVLNLTHRNGHAPDKVAPLVPGEKYAIAIDMVADSYTVQKGHRLRLAVSTNYWPLIWPSLKAVTATIYSGLPSKSGRSTPKTSLVLPLYDLKLPAGKPLFNEPNLPPPIEEIYDREPNFTRTIKFSLSGDERSVEVLSDSGRKYMPIVKTIMDETVKKVYSIKENDPLSAWATIEHDVIMEWPEASEGHVKIRIITKNEMTCDENNFYLTNDLKTFLNNELFFEKTWKDSVKRELV